MRCSCQGEGGDEAQCKMEARRGVRAQSLCGCVLTVKDSATAVGVSKGLVASG